MQDLKALTVTTVWKTQFSPQHSPPKKEKKVTRAAEILFTSLVQQWPSLTMEAFSTPTGTERKTTPQGRKKVLKSSVIWATRHCSHVCHYQASFSRVRKATNTWTLLSSTALEKNTEFAHVGSSVSLIALCSQGIWFLLVLSLINTLRVQSSSF